MKNTDRVSNLPRRGILAWLAIAATLVCATAAPTFGDSPVPSGFRPYPLQHVDVESVAVELRKALAATAQILIDPQNNRILVSGDEAANRTAGDLVRMLDQPQRAPRQSVADARQTVRGYRAGAGGLQRLADELRQRYATNSAVHISIDQRANQVLVYAPAEIQREISAAVDRTGQGATNLRPLANRPTLRQNHQLQQLSWQEFESSFQRLWPQGLSVRTERNGELAAIDLSAGDGAPTTMYIDRPGNQVTIEGPDIQVESWQKVVQLLDRRAASKDDTTQLVPFADADPSKVFKAVSLLGSLAKGAAEGEATAIVPVNKQPPASPGGRLVSLIFQQPDEAEGAGADDPAPDAAPPRIDPRTGLPIEGDDRDTGLYGDVRVEFLESLDLIIIRGHPEDVARVTRIIKQIQEQALTTQPDVEVYQLRFINSQAVAALVTQLYEQVYASRQGPVSVTALQKPNALLLVGRQENLNSVTSLIKQLDRPVPPATQLEIFQLRWMSAVDAAQRLTDFYQLDAQTTAADDATGGLATRVRVVADYRSNSLIVQASPRDLAEVAQFLRGIDVEENQSMHELRIFPLNNSIAADLAPVLQDAINGQLEGAGRATTGTGVTAAATQTGVARVRSTMLSLMTVKDGQLLKSGILYDVRVVADPNSNTLIVTAPTNSMDLIKALIDQLDSLPSAEAIIKVFTILNGDATSLGAMLQQLFGQDVTVGQAGFGQAAVLRAAFPQTTAAGGESSLVPIRIAVDTRTNSIVASGTDGDLNVVETILTRLDEEGIDARKTTVYRLQNAPAVDVANAITTVLQQQTNLQLQQAQLTGILTVGEQFESQVFIVPEAVSNSLIISASPRFYDEVLQTVKDLDQRPPMVMIQVVIAEVAFNDTFEFGVEMGLQDSLLFDRGINGTSALMPGFPFNTSQLGNQPSGTSLATRENLAGQALSNLSLGRLSSEVGYGGLVLSAGNESINLLLRALQDNSNVRVLSRPQVMTLDNQVAFVQVGQRVSRITGSQITQQGNSQNSVADVNVGIILRVQPRISPDGVVVMLLDTERSDLGSEAEGTQVAVDSNGNAVRSPPINTTTASTTLSARSGQTVVFSGLLTKRNVNARRGIPVLSELPGIGPLFRFDTEIEQRTELMIIMTPYIIKDDEDYEWINRSEMDRMNWCLSDVVQMHGNLGTYAGEPLNAVGPSVIYPDLDPTGGGGLPVPIHPTSYPEPDAPLQPIHRPAPAEAETSAATVRPVQPPPSDAAVRQYEGDPQLTRVTYGESPGPNPVRNAPYQEQAAPNAVAPAYFERDPRDNRPPGARGIYEEPTQPQKR